MFKIKWILSNEIQNWDCTWLNMKKMKGTINWLDVSLFLYVGADELYTVLCLLLPYTYTYYLLLFYTDERKWKSLFVLKSVGPKMFDFEFACSFFVKKDRPDIGKHAALLGLKTGGERYLAECLRQTAAHFSYTSARLNRTFQTHGLML